jgi:hypothetical protein
VLAIREKYAGDRLTQLTQPHESGMRLDPRALNILDVLRCTPGREEYGGWFPVTPQDDVEKKDDTADKTCYTFALEYRAP